MCKRTSPFRPFHISANFARQSRYTKQQRETTSQLEINIKLYKQILQNPAPVTVQLTNTTRGFWIENRNQPFQIELRTWLPLKQKTLQGRQYHYSCRLMHYRKYQIKRKSFYNNSVKETSSSCTSVPVISEVF